MTVGGYDSSFDTPTLGQAKAARQAGIRVWGGYFGSRDGLGLAVRWSESSFRNVLEAGLTAIGFCSGWDDPDWIRITAEAWGILACVDVEPRIRDDGTWVRGWVLQAQAGLYGLASVHYQSGEPDGRGAYFNVVADYLDSGCSGASWVPWLDSRRPPAPCGWQCQGGHRDPITGLDVDSSFFDEAILGGRGGPEVLDPNDPIVKQLLMHTNTAAAILALGEDTDPTTFQPLPGNPRWLTDQINALSASVAKLSAPTVDVGALAAALAPHLPPATDPQAVAKAVALELGKALDAAP